MNKELENANLRNALRHASGLLSELRTSTLAPRNYYILFMAVFDEMRGTHR
jgi:vacuolar protein sorting-associated protein 35